MNVVDRANAGFEEANADEVDSFEKLMMSLPLEQLRYLETYCVRGNHVKALREAYALGLIRGKTDMSCGEYEKMKMGISILQGEKVNLWNECAALKRLARTLIKATDGVLKQSNLARTSEGANCADITAANIAFDAARKAMHAALAQVKEPRG